MPQIKQQIKRMKTNEKSRLFNQFKTQCVLLLRTLN